jgi:hypothetical protein
MTNLKLETNCFCCLCDSGNLLLDVLFEKNTYTPGEVCQAAVSLDLNQAKEDARSISFVVTQFVEVIPGPLTHHVEYIVASGDLPTPKKGTKIIKESLKFKLSPAETGDIWDVPVDSVWNYIKNKHTQVNLPRVNNDTSSLIVKSRIEMKIIVVFATSRKLEKTVTIPLDIQPAEVIVNTLPPTPENWNPTLMPAQDYLNLTKYFLKGDQTLNKFGGGINPVIAPLTANQGMPMSSNQNIEMLSQSMEKIQVPMPQSEQPMRRSATNE